MNLKFLSNSGQVCEIPVQELLEVDGRPFQNTDPMNLFAERMAHLEGRVAAIETIFTRQEEGETP